LVRINPLDPDLRFQLGPRATVISMRACAVIDELARGRMTSDLPQPGDSEWKTALPESWPHSRSYSSVDGPLGSCGPGQVDGKRTNGGTGFRPAPPRSSPTRIKHVTDRAFWLARDSTKAALLRLGTHNSDQLSCRRSCHHLPSAGHHDPT
jgi:hypothetical protein